MHIGIAEMNAQQREQDATIEKAQRKARLLRREYGFAGALRYARERRDAAGILDGDLWHETVLALEEGRPYVAEIRASGQTFLNGRLVARDRTCHQHRAPGWDGCPACQEVRRVRDGRPLGA